MSRRRASKWMHMGPTSASVPLVDRQSRTALGVARHLRALVALGRRAHGGDSLRPACSRTIERLLGLLLEVANLRNGRLHEGISGRLCIDALALASEAYKRILGPVL